MWVTLCEDPVISNSLAKDYGGISAERLEVLEECLKGQTQRKTCYTSNHVAHLLDDPRESHERYTAWDSVKRVTPSKAPTHSHIPNYKGFRCSYMGEKERFCPAFLFISNPINTLTTFYINLFD
ncbi:hypothetical protein BC827DRAFT_1157141 [Russula dissimulans]|nr:hypothetical protein BC827DRAFT_1157141 [Russula dissimulans]